MDPRDDAAPGAAAALAWQTPPTLPELPRLLAAGPFAGVERTLFASLRDAGFSDVARVADAQEALRQLVSPQPDLLLLDLPADIGEACATCAAFYAAMGDAVPIVAIGSFREAADRARILDAGAANVLGAPLRIDELLRRIDQRLRSFRLARQLQKFRDRLDEELAVARAAQVGLLPSPAALASIRAMTGLDVAAHAETSSELGGDIWGLHALDSRRLTVFLADFSGHGIAAALNAFRLHTMMTERLLLAQLDPEQVLELLNERLAALLARGVFATMFYGVLDLDRNVLAYASAGAPTPLLALPDGSIAEVDTSGLPLAMRSGHRYAARWVPFARGAAILLHSDALIEAPDWQGQVWTTETLRDCLADTLHRRQATATVGRVLDDFASTRPRPLPDDLTIVCIRRPE